MPPLTAHKAKVLLLAQWIYENQNNWKGQAVSSTLNKLGMFATIATPVIEKLGELIPAAGIINAVTGEDWLQNHRPLRGRERVIAGEEAVASIVAAPVIAKGLGAVVGKVNSLGVLAKSQIGRWWGKDLSLFQKSQKLDISPTVKAAEEVIKNVETKA